MKMSDIETAVSAYFGMDITLIKCHTRKKEIIYAKHIMYWLIRKHTVFSFLSIGNFYGYSYSSIINACQKIDNERKLYPDVAMDIVRIENALKFLGE
jgi:chromosomal replication initiation ATPase DnaA